MSILALERKQRKESSRSKIGRKQKKEIPNQDWKKAKKNKEKFPINDRKKKKYT